MLHIGLTLFVTKVNGFSTEMVHLWTKCRWSQYASCVWWAWQYVVLEKIISTGTKLSDNSMLFNALMPVEIEDSLTQSYTYFIVLLTTLILSRVCLMLIIMIIIWQFYRRKKKPLNVNISYLNVISNYALSLKTFLNATTNS